MKSPNLLKIPPSETVRINTLALEKLKAGERIVNLTAGEPVMAIPPVIKAAVRRCLESNQSRYPEVAGLPELRRAAATWMNQVYQSSFSKDNTLVVPGGKFGLFLLLQAILRRGDEVLIPSPFWVSYPGMVKLFGAGPVIIKTTEAAGWKITARDVIRNCSAKTQVLILNNGSNPTGVLYSKKELKLILAAAARKNLFVISDEVYSGLVYDRQKYISCSQFQQHRNRVAVIQSCSKNFAIPGFRVGFVFAPTEIIKVLTSLLSQSASGVSVLSQQAALAALRNAGSITRSVRRQMEQRRNNFVREFHRRFAIRLTPPRSALYVFVPVSALGESNLNSNEYCELALSKANVALVPGKAFGQEGYVRFSFGDRPEVVSKAIKQLSIWQSQK